MENLVKNNVQDEFLIEFNQIIEFYSKKKILEFEKAVELLDELVKMTFENLTYTELEDKCYELEFENDRLQRELEYYQEVS